MADLTYPRYYLDFETIMPPVPIWADTRPYETLPIQWSCHYELAPGKMEHAEFLDLSGDPPMLRLAESLVRVLGSEGPILTYTQYEKRVINGLIARFPDLQRPLAAIVGRLVVLAVMTAAAMLQLLPGELMVALAGFAMFFVYFEFIGYRARRVAPNPWLLAIFQAGWSALAHASLFPIIGGA